MVCIIQIALCDIQSSFLQNSDLIPYSETVQGDTFIKAQREKIYTDLLKKLFFRKFYIYLLEARCACYDLYVLVTTLGRGVEGEPPHFLVQAIFCKLPCPSHIKMLVLQFFFF